MKKHIFYAIIGVFLPLFANCQFWEIGVLGGGSNYIGNLSQETVNLGQTHPAGGAFVRYNLNSYWTLQGSVYYGFISGADSFSSDPNVKQQNLSFRSHILEISGTVEYNIWPYMAGNKRYNNFSSTLYPFAGLCVFNFNPEADYKGKWVPLQPLGTQGQGTTLYNTQTKYALTQIGIPLGLGFKHNYGGNWSLGAEIGVTKTFTPFLDDVGGGAYTPPGYLARNVSSLSEALSNRSGELEKDGVAIDYYAEGINRGNSTAEDWFMFAGISISYTILPSMCYKF